MHYVGTADYNIRSPRKSNFRGLSVGHGPLAGECGAAHPNQPCRDMISRWGGIVKHLFGNIGGRNPDSGLDSGAVDILGVCKAPGNPLGIWQKSVWDAARGTGEKPGKGTRYGRKNVCVEKTQIGL